jgi:hypothetical protein
MDALCLFIQVAQLSFHGQEAQGHATGNNSARQSIFEAFMTNEQTVNSGAHGVRWGLMIGGVYVVLVLLRYIVGSGSFMAYSAFTIVGFFAVMFLLFLSGRKLRSQNGGWIEMREAFKSMFISVLIFEFFFLLTTLIYLKYIDPNFFEKMRVSTENMLISARASQSDIDAALQNLDQMQAQQYSQVTVLDFLKSYLYTVGIIGLFALLFAFILKRKPPVFPQENEYSQS